MIVEKDKLLTEVKEEIERVKEDRVDTEARAVAAYQDGFEGTFEYRDLAHHFMTADREQLIEMIVETHPEWDISFLRDVPGKVTTSAKLQDVGEAQILTPTPGKGSRYADPSGAARQ
ncbi:hypothetical protein Adt_23396 [Abeliophyllum distichum]|uniref:Uncharacterized protein n=1 Tax=Abeliophyllum distichum TaxID=126358 RepID=A0ABD1SB02_9LAMI